MNNRQIVQAQSTAPMAWDAIKSDKEKVVDRVKLMIVNGKKLNNDEVYALTAFSLANDLNPFNGEAYFIPGAGPVPGIAGYRKKSKMALRIEAKENGVRAPFFTEEYELITDPKEAGHDPEKGDIAYRCIVQDNVSQQGHADILTDAMAKLIKAGVDVNDAYKAAEKIAGDPPQWTGIGIVYSDEYFGKKEMFSRHERAMKRAAKVAIKKRWATLDLPSDAEGMDYEEPTITVSSPEPKQIEEPKQKQSNDEILDELGFDDSTTSRKPPFEEDQKDEEVVEGEYVEEPESDEAVAYPGSQAELMAFVARGQVPYVGMADAKEIVDANKGDLKVSWDLILEVSADRKAEANKQPDLGI